jgi:hypothetical protein
LPLQILALQALDQFHQTNLRLRLAGILAMIAGRRGADDHRVDAQLRSDRGWLGFGVWLGLWLSRLPCRQRRWRSVAVIGRDPSGGRPI